MDHQPISSLIDSDTIVSVDEDHTMDMVQSILRIHNLTYVPVLDAHGHIFGIITARDMLNFHASRKSPKAVRAWEVCTHKTIQVSPHKPVQEVAQLMVEHHIHHVLVSDQGMLKGVISSFDIVEKYMVRSMMFA
jgi:CBS domain-containing protein